MGEKVELSDIFTGAYNHASFYIPDEDCRGELIHCKGDWIKAIYFDYEDYVYEGTLESEDLFQADVEKVVLDGLRYAKTGEIPEECTTY